MVETNNDEERLARIERTIEQLQRESAAFGGLAAKMVRVVVEAVPSLASALPPTKKPVTRKR